MRQRAAVRQSPLRSAQRYQVKKKNFLTKDFGKLSLNPGSTEKNEYERINNLTQKVIDQNSCMSFIVAILGSYYLSWLLQMRLCKIFMGELYPPPPKQPITHCATKAQPTGMLSAH